MSKKTIKAAKTASKTTKATADKATAADKPNEQAKPDGGCKQNGKCGAGKIITILTTSLIANDVVLIAVANDNAVPEALRRMAKSAMDINHATMETVKGIIGKEGK